MLASQRYRSVLYVPASNARALEKAAGLAADVLILDLEDAVAPEAKALAREQAAAALGSGVLAGRHVVVRVNGLGAGGEAAWQAQDLARLAACPPAGILFPKISSADAAILSHHALRHHFGSQNVALWLMIETPLAILNLAEIAATRRQGAPALAALVVGSNDLAKEMRIPAAMARHALLTALSLSVIAARAHDLVVIDGVYGALADAAGCEAEAWQGRGLGFDGKSLVHPDQIAIANRVFAPTAAELAEARAIIAAFEASENAGKGVLRVNGAMVEGLHYAAALRLVALG